MCGGGANVKHNKIDPKNPYLTGMTKHKKDIQFSQGKLDVLEKKRTNLFNWRGQFTPQFVEYLLNTFGEAGQTVLDPFSGSGTVLLEAAGKNMKAVGFEINPAAYAMSAFYAFCNIDIHERYNILKSFEDTLQEYTSNLNGEDLFVESSSYRVSYANFIDFCESLSEEMEGKSERIILLNLLFLSEKHKKLKLKESLGKSYNYIKKILIGLPHSDALIQANLADARNTHKYLDNEVDLILTSPPYINVFNYHQNYRAIVESFGFEILKVAHSEFGSNRKNRGNRFRTVVQYCLDMEQAIYSFWQTLKPEGKMILVVGRESNVRKTPFYNGQIVKEIIKKTGGFDILQVEERAFFNKFGKLIKEDIIIAEKNEHFIDVPKNGQQIADKHLKEALKITTGEIRTDVENALSEIDRILPSPLFDPASILNR